MSTVGITAIAMQPITETTRPLMSRCSAVGVRVRRPAAPEQRSNPNAIPLNPNPNHNPNPNPNPNPSPNPNPNPNEEYYRDGYCDLLFDEDGEVCFYAVKVTSL